MSSDGENYAVVDLCMVVPLQKTFMTACGVHTSRGRARNAPRELRGAARCGTCIGRAPARVKLQGGARARPRAEQREWWSLVVAVRLRLVARLQSSPRE